MNYAVLALLAALPIFGATTQEQRTPTISFESKAIVISGVTPHAQVVLFGVEREPWGYAMRTREFSATLESDERGNSRYDLQRTIVRTSIVAAVDTISGDFAVASPEGIPVNVRPADALRMKRKAGQEFEAFELEAQWVKVICVRPGHGAWKLSLADGSSGDESAAPGTLQAGAALMKPLGNETASLARFRLRDVLIAIDPYTMTVVATAVNE